MEILIVYVVVSLICSGLILWECYTSSMSFTIKDMLSAITLGFVPLFNMIAVFVFFEDFWKECWLARMYNSVGQFFGRILDYDLKRKKCD